MASLTPRERVLRTIGLKEPDRVPIDIGSTHTTSLVAPAYDQFKEYLGVTSETKIVDNLSQVVCPDEEILERFHVDLRMLAPGASSFRGALAGTGDGSITTEWGFTYSRPEGGHYYISEPTFKDNPPSMAALDNFNWPDPTDPKRVEGLGEAAEKLHRETDYAVALYFPGRVLSLGQFMRGFGPWLEDLLVNQKFAGALMDRGLEIQLEIGGRVLEAVGDNVDIIYVADDLGGQTGPLMSPDLYRKMIKPRQRKLFDFMRSHSDAKIMVHSCGSVHAFIGDLVDMGVDAVNPVQISAKDMEPGKLKREFGDKICFWGGIDTHRVLPFGSPREVRDEVKRVIEELGPGGGYICSSVHNIQKEVPPENICAMLEAALEYGKYN